MEAEGKRRKVEETVIEILKDDANWEEATENKVRKMAADRLGGAADLSDMDHRRLVRRLVESYLLPLDDDDDDDKVEEETKEIVQQEQENMAIVDLKEMNFQADTFDTDFLDGGSNEDNEFEIECSDQAGQSHNQLLCLSIESSETPSERRSAKKRAQRSCNFTIEEDNLLVLTWLNVSLDLVYIQEQKKKPYWQRMYDYFHKHKSFPTDRSCTSLMNRWSTIQLAVNNFCGCYAQIVARNESDASDIDKILQAKLLYHKTHRAPFQFEHCWNKLRDQPKWLEVGQKRKAKKSKLASPCAFSPSPLNSFKLSEDSKQCDTIVELERPIGREGEKEHLEKQNEKVQVDNPIAALTKETSNEREQMMEKKVELLERPVGREAEKERLGKQNEKVQVDNSIAALTKETSDGKKQMMDKKMELLERTYAQELERLRLQRMQLEMEQQKEDERIMCIDTTGMPPLQAEYYRLRQKEILSKSRGNSCKE